MNLALSARNRSASIRIPMYSKSPKAKRLEFRCPDPSCNGYLAWSAMLMAMLDGIQNKIDPGRPLDRDIYEMTRDEMKHRASERRPDRSRRRSTLSSRTTSSSRAAKCSPRIWCRRGSTWKREKELDPIRLRPHPHEFYLYYDN